MIVYYALKPQMHTSGQKWHMEIISSQFHLCSRFNIFFLILIVAKQLYIKHENMKTKSNPHAQNKILKLKKCANSGKEPKIWKTQTQPGALVLLWHFCCISTSWAVLAQH